MGHLLAACILLAFGYEIMNGYGSESGLLAVVEAKSTLVFPNPPVTPDFNRPLMSIILITFILFIPCNIIGIILLWNRRTRFPIAGRGSGYLLVFGCLCLGYCLICSVGGFVYPYGFPCGVEYMLHFCFSIPVAVIYMLRSWTLVCRLEMMNYLTELRWRQEKRKMMKEYEEQQAIEVNEAEVGANGSSQGTAASEIKSTKILVQSQAVEEDPSTIPGYFFIHHRQWIEPKFLFPFVGGLSVVILSAMVLVAVVDPDIKLTNDELHKEGILPVGVDYTESQFAPDTFFSSPICLSYDIKVLLYNVILVALVMPVLIWCSWRIYLDKGRQVTRKKDQADCYKLVHGKELEAVETTKEKLGLSMDDSQNVKNELGIIIIGVLIDAMLYILIQQFNSGYAVLALEYCYIFLFFVTIVMPLYLSYSVSRKHRQLIDGSRMTASNANTIKKLGAKDGTIIHRLPHQRPYFTLKYILHQSHTYDVLLAFLQKEYSSENALFWTESREFEKAAKVLEAKIPNWPSSMDPDAEGTQGTDTSGDILGSRTKASALNPSKMMKLSIASTPALGPMTLFKRTSSLQTSSSNPSADLTPLALSPTSADATSSATLDLPMMTMSSPTSVISPNGRTRSIVSTTVTLAPAEKIDFSELHAEARRLKAWAEKIYDDYVKRAAVMEINIQEDLSKLVQSQIAQLSSWSPTPLTQVTGDPDQSFYPLQPPFPLSTLYRQTRLAVFDLIQRDSFRRFILTPGFQQLLHQADEDELARLEKQNDLMLDTADVVDKAMEEICKPLQLTYGGTSQQRVSGLSGGRQFAGNSVVNNAGASRLQQDQPSMLDESPTLPGNEDDIVNDPLPGTPLTTAATPLTVCASPSKHLTLTRTRAGSIEECNPEDEEEEPLPQFEQLPPQASPLSASPQPFQPDRAELYIGTTVDGESDD